MFEYNWQLSIGSLNVQETVDFGNTVGLTAIKLRYSLFGILVHSRIVLNYAN
jgi:hypothetical protein